MAAIISISSDEEEFDELKGNPRKKIKTNELENDEKKKYASNNKHNDSDIESDEIQCDKNNKNGSSKDTKTSNSFVSESITQDKCNKNISIESDDDNLTDVSINDEINEPKNLDLDKQSLNLAEMFSDCKEMQIFIDLCLSQIHSEETKTLFKSKLPLCKKVFDKTDKEYIKSECFKTFLEEKTILSKTGSIKAVSSFNDVYQHLKTQIRKTKTNINITSKNKVIIEKLDHALGKIHRKIIKLEESEIDFDDEENSNYIKLQRYKERAVKIHEKLCKYNKQDAHANHILYSRLDFSGSNYPEFNHAINRKFKNNLVFPTYYEVECCLRKVITDKNMNLTESKFKNEAKECFKCLGNLLQKRRKMDLLDIHSHYLTANSDPAYTDRELDAKLNASFKEAKSKIDLICEKYTKLQDAGVDPSLSSDSDDSKQKCTDSEEDE